jgi:1,2-diacylglycerol 3-beta-galactosyltransferase
VLNEKAQSRGLDPSQIVQCGLPIRKGFWSKKGNGTGKQPNFMQKMGGKKPSMPAKSGIRSELGLDPDLPTVLVVGGGDGMGGIVDIASALGDKLGENSEIPAYQMVVVCGNNKEAQTKLASKSWGSGVKVDVQGFVNNMDEWMDASDTLVTKAGPGTIAEASICGLPCMLFAYL